MYSGNCGEQGSEDAVKWYFNSAEGVLTISGNGKMADYAEASQAPWYYLRDYIKSVVVESGVENGDIIPMEAESGVNKIGSYAFAECENIEKAVIPETVVDIGEHAFPENVSEQMVFYVAEGSYAETWAVEKGFKTERGNEETVVYGDANNDGSITAADSAAILQKVLNNSYIPAIEEAYGYEKALKYLDVNVDNKLTAADSAMVLQKVLNSSFTMTVEE